VAKAYHLDLDRRDLKGAAIALLLVAILLTGFAPGRSAGAPERTGRRMQMLGLTNGDRIRHDRKALDFAAKLSRYAKQHSREMADSRADSRVLFQKIKERLAHERKIVL